MQLIYTYEELKPHQHTLKKFSTLQFLKLYQQNVNRKEAFDKYATFGFEIEAQVLKKLPSTSIDDNLDNNRYSIQDQVDYLLGSFPQDDIETVREYGSWCVEFIPLTPMNSFLSGKQLSNSLQALDLLTNKIIQKCDKVFLAPFNPFINTKQFLRNHFKLTDQQISELPETNIFSKSAYMCDDMTGHPIQKRHFARNTRLRAQETFEARVPLFKDLKTIMNQPLDFEKYPGQVLLDSHCQGMVHHAFQMTFAASDITEATWLTDQFNVLSPIMMALSAGTPCQKGKLVDWDTRFPVLQALCDDRTPREKSEKSKNLTQSRYSLLRLYISSDSRNLKIYNDLPYSLNKKIKKFTKLEAKKRGLKIEEGLLNHWAQICHKDLPLVTQDMLGEDTQHDTENFEYLQSKTWNNVRFKPAPSLNSDMPWRVELRSMDSLFTYKQAYYFGYLTQILQRMIVCKKFGLNLYIPMSCVHQNMERGWMRAAATEAKFYFRQNIFDEGSCVLIEITIQEIFEGNNEFLGLFKVLDQFIELNKDEIQKESEETQECVVTQMKNCFNYFLDLSKGDILTNASLVRQFVQQHPSYQQDSILTEEIQHGLVEFLLKRQNAEK